MAGINFNTTPPSAVFNGSMVAHYSCASIADATGNLLFYTDGDTIWNASHSPMANGTGLNGNNGISPQGVIILKQPGNTNIYYVVYVSPITLTSSIGTTYYAVVDMSLASGSGSVTIKNAALFAGPVTGKLTATKHCNGTDIWLIQRESKYWSVGTGSFTPNFRANLLTSAGLNTTAVVSAGATYSLVSPGSTLNAGQYWGHVKVSPNGKKIGVTNEHIGAANVPGSLICFELYDFDNTTGVVSNSLALPTHTSGVSTGWGCEFSPDGTKFYGSRPGSFSSGVGLHFYQWDLCAGSPTAIVASIYSIITLSNNANFGTLQLAPDGKIYCLNSSSWFNTTIDAINNPNLAGAACGFSTSVLSTSPNNVHWALPNFMTSDLLKPPVSSPFTYIVNNSFGCQSVQFNSPGSPGGCATAGYTLTNIAWNFGDPTSGASNTSNLTNPVHAFTNLGTYTVQLILYYSCGGGTDTLKQVVNVNQPCITVNSTSITCASLGSATVSSFGGGPFSYTWMPTNQTGSVATGLSPGTYTLVVFDPGSNSTYTSQTVFVPLIPLTGTASHVNSVACHGISTGTGAVTNLAGGSGSQNYLWTNGSLSYTTAYVNSLGSGTWSVTVTDALTACQVYSVFTIIQPPALTLNISSNTPSICVGGSIILTGTNSGGTPSTTGPAYTYSWINGGTVNTKTVNEAVGGTYVYTLISQDGNNCPASNTISVDFINNPVLSLSDVSVCPLQYGTLFVTGAASFTWNNNINGNLLIDNPLVTTQYTVVGSAMGCTTAATASIILKPTPFPFTQSNSPKCENSTINLSAYGGIAFVWSGPNGFSSSVQHSSLNSVSLNDAGIYNVTVTAVNSCTASATATVVVNPTPTLSVLGSTVCTSGTLNLSANSFTGSSYQWSGPFNFSSSSQNPFIVNPALNRSGNYSVKVTSAQGCTNMATTHCSVVVPPSLTISLSGTGSLCAQALNGSPNTITLTSGGANVYTLTTPNNLYVVSPNGPVTGLSSVPPFSGTFGYATATLVGSNGICTSSTTAIFTIVPNPTVGINSYTPVICAGQSYTYTSNGANSYTWGPNSPGLTTYTSPVTVASPTVTSIYSVVGGSLGCNSPTKTSTLTIFPLTTVSISPYNPNLCLNEKITLTALGNGTSFSWLPYEGLNNIVGQSVIASPSVTKTYTVIASANNCTNSAVTTINVLPLPNPLFNISKKEICLNESVQLSGEGGISYEFRGPDDLYYQNQTVTLTANHISYAGVYTLTVTDKNNCKNSVSESLIVHTLPNGSLKGDMEGCVPYCGKFSFSGNTSSTTASWKYEGQNKTGNNFEFCFEQTGIQTVKGYFHDQTTGCRNEEHFNITVHEKPFADFTFEPQAPIEGLNWVQFTNTSQGGKSFNWYFINNKGYSTKTENPNYLFENTGVYPIALVVKNQWNCLDTIVKTIKVEPDFSIYIPNTFTPNDDDKNEVFLPVLRGEKLYTLQIFNRWGTKIFESKNPAQGWDGTFQGESCKQDVYTWRIRVSSLDGEAKEYTGHVLLHR
jgi:gliding motility-associated-like protein